MAITHAVSAPLIVIPAYGEAAHIETVVRRARRYAAAVLVIDDGSADDTADRARRAGAEVIVHPANRGKGAALATAFREAQRRGFDWVVTLDGDGQHDPAQVPRFLRAAARCGADIVVGTRIRDHSTMPVVRRCSNALTSAVIRRLTHQRLTDTQSGFRLVRTAAWQAATPTTHSYDAESEFLIAACRRGFRVAEVSIPTIYGAEQSTINPLTETCRFVRLVARAMLGPYLD